MVIPTAIGEGEANATPLDLPDGGVDAPNLRYFVMALFFIFGGITSLNDVIIPKLKELFTLNYTQAMLVQFCFFTAYLVIGIPGAQLVKKIGYMRGAVAGLLTMMVGCLLFIPASRTATYGLFLLALFVLASGVVVVQVVSNPLISLLGPPKTVHSRLTFAQAFNSLGTTIFPPIGSALILGGLAGVTAAQLSGTALDDYRTSETHAIVSTYIGLAVALAVIAAVVWMFRNKLPGEKHDHSSPLAGFSLIKRPRFGFGAMCIFLYVGAEVSIGSLIVNYLIQKDVLGTTAEAAGKMVAFYWGGAMVGRFVGALVMWFVRPGRVLAFNAAAAVVLLVVAMATAGETAMWSVLAIGLCNSIMFPTIFALALTGLGKRTGEGSGVLCMAIVGGAIVPVIQGYFADHIGILHSFAVPVACYLYIVFYGLSGHRPAAR